MAYHGDKFLLIGAVTIVNNRDHTLHYAIEEEIKSRTFLINSAEAQKICNLKSMTKFYNSFYNPTFILEILQPYLHT